jgi:hypothetical protein
MSVLVKTDKPHREHNESSIADETLRHWREQYVTPTTSTRSISAKESASPRDGFWEVLKQVHARVCTRDGLLLAIEGLGAFRRNQLTGHLV